MEAENLSNVLAITFGVVTIVIAVVAVVIATLQLRNHKKHRTESNMERAEESYELLETRWGFCMHHCLNLSLTAAALTSAC